MGDIERIQSILDGILQVMQGLLDRIVVQEDGKCDCNCCKDFEDPPGWQSRCKVCLSALCVCPTTEGSP